MKLSAVAAAGLFAVALGTKPKKCSKNCFNAIVSDTPADLGEAFCSSFLSLQPLEAAATTVTVVRGEVVTTTNTNSETTTTTVTTTDATITTTTGTILVLANRAQTLVDPSPSILSACKTKSALISSICSHLLPAATTAPASTVTVEQTSTSTTVVELTVRLPAPLPPSEPCLRWRTDKWWIDDHGRDGHRHDHGHRVCRRNSAGHSVRQWRLYKQHLAVDNR